VRRRGRGGVVRGGDVIHSSAPAASSDPTF
jgi:hypothetical protein